MNLAVDYIVNYIDFEDEIIYDTSGRHTYIFNYKFKPTQTYSNKNNIYLGIKSNIRTDEIRIGYKKEEFGGFEYYFRTDNLFMSIDSSFCNENICDVKGYLRNYERINGYNLIFTDREEHALIFKLKLVTQNDYLQLKRKCFVTTIKGKDFILLYHPKYKKLVLFDELIPGNSADSFNNILFITDNEELYKNCKNLDLPAYRNIKLLSDI